MEKIQLVYLQNNLRNLRYYYLHIEKDDPIMLQGTEMEICSLSQFDQDKRYSFRALIVETKAPKSEFYLNETENGQINIL